MDTVEILEKARELISDESRWTQQSYARNAEGNNVGPSDPTATCFCIYGAICNVMGKQDTLDGELYSVAEGVAYSLGYSYPQALFDFNDSHDHPAVLALIDRAIAAAREA